MLVIREPQIRVFEIERKRDFEQHLAVHCRQYFPRPSSALGDALMDAIREAIERAQSHGFLGEREICKYINLVFTFGREFDRSPLIEWAAPVLFSSLPGPAKMERLYAAAIRHELQGRGYFAPFEEPR
jgi:hypothetical protein